MADEIKRDVKDGGFSSVSEFIRTAVREYRREKVFQKIKKGEKEFASGKTKTVHSFTELRKLR